MNAAIELLLLSLLLAPAGAQPDIFADPQNLEVLPKDIDSRKLGGIMRGFALGLGVRCETCHVGEPGQDLSEFDFASDEKDTKLAAREMLKMVQTINRDFIGKLDGERTQVDCVRCHRGLLKPRLTGEALKDVLSADGFAAMRAEYLQLREKYYGTHSYDFSESVLAGVADAVSDDLDSAEAVMKLNLEYFPDGFRSHFTLAEIYARKGDKPAARNHYRRAMALNPNPFVQQRLERLDD